MAFNDALSLIMLVDKIKRPEKLELLKGLRPEYLEQVMLNIPENLRTLMADVLTVLLDRSGVEAGEIGELRGRLLRQEGQGMFDELVEAILEDKRQAREEGIHIGAERTREEEQERAYKEKLDAARRFKAEGFSLDKIAEILNLPLDTVLAL
jgi:hypothetical protein